MKHVYRILQILNRWKGYYLFAGVLLSLHSIIRMLEPKVLQIAIDGVVVFFLTGNSPNMEEADAFAAFFYKVLPEITLDNLSGALFWTGMLLVMVAVLQAATRFFSSVLSAFSTENAIKRLRDRLFQHIQALPLAHFEKVPTGELIQRCTGDVDTVRNFINGNIVELIRLLSVFFGAFFMMYLVHPTYAFIAIALVPFIGITSAYFFKRESKVWETHEEEQDKLTAIIQENLSGIRVVQAFAREDHEVKKFIQQNQRKLEIGIEHVDLHMKFWPFSDTLVNIQIALSLLAGAYFTLHQQITVGEFASFFTYSIMVTWPMRGVGRIVSQLGMTAVAMDRIAQILNAKEEEYEGQYEDLPIKGDIEFRNVYFRYKAEDNWVLEDVSFHIKAGEKVALMGQTGSGKSSIIALLCRFYKPEKGQIFIDGKPIEDYAKRALRQRIGLVHQKAFLFSTTIKENIAFTNTGSKEAVIMAAAKDASVESFIHKMPKGYDTLVGEKGVTLSGGQKQRVSLARTLLSNPDILVLDDATSAVDTETEFEIQEALTQRMKNKTTILIAHRLTSVQQADWILVLEQGKVIQRGKHEELLQEAGFYRKVYQIQVALEKDIEAELYS